MRLLLLTLLLFVIPHLVSCKAPPPCTPTLDAVANPFESGQQTWISGSCLGKTAGRVRITGNFPTTKTLDLKIDSWADDRVFAEIPDMT